MANHIFKVMTEKMSSRQFNIELYITSSTGNPYTLVEGDTVTFKWESAVGGGSPSQLNFGNLDIFTDSSFGTLYSAGTSFTRTVRSGGSMPEAGSPRVSTNGSGFHYWYVSRVSAVDTLPDSFSLGPNVVNANPSQTYYTSQFTVTGINTSVLVTATNGGLVSKNNGNYAASQTVVAGDKVRISLGSLPSYSASKTSFVSVGSGSSSFSITNMASPGSGQIIPLGITSGQINLSQIGDLFGRPLYSVDTKLSDYRKAPTLTRVPDIVQNSSVPTGFPIKLTNFYGSATSFYISTYPSNKVINYDTTSAGGNFNHRWTVGTDWFLGYHPDIMNVAEFMYTFTQAGTYTDARLTSAISPAVWSNINRTVQVEVTVPKYVERGYRGVVTVYARHPKAPTKVVSASMSYWFEFYGP